MKVVATINHNIDKDTANILLKNWTQAIIEEKLSRNFKDKRRFVRRGKIETTLLQLWDMGHGKTSLIH